jgi:hypothetical protein
MWITSRCKILAANKFRNAGQVCVAPTRFLVQEKVYRPVRREASPPTAKALKVGNGLDEGTQMGPLANAAASGHRRLIAATPCQKGAEMQTGGQPHRQQGLLLRADGHHQRAARCADHERGAVRPAGADGAVQGLRRSGSRKPTACPSASPAYAFTTLGQDGERGSPPRSRAA